jgi:hypothetical protein
MKKMFGSFKRKTLLFGTASLVITATLFQGCIKETYDMDKIAQNEWNPNLAIPLVYSSLTVKDILSKHGDDAITVDGTGFVTLVYHGNLFSLKAEDFMSIPSANTNLPAMSFTAAEVTGYLAVGNGNSYTVNKSISTPIAITTPNGGALIDSIVFKGGLMDFTLASTFQQSGTVVISMPGAKKNGVPLSISVPIVYAGNVPVTPVVPTVALNGYTIAMNPANQVTINYTITLVNNGNPLTVTNTLSSTFALTNPLFSKIFGYIGQQSISPNADTVGIKIFRNALGNGTFTLVDPKIKVYISNSFGVPILAALQQFEGYTSGFNPWPITGVGIPSPLPINSPTYAQIGQSLQTNFTLDKNNSNIVSLINNKPKNIIYKINSQTNPNGNGTPNFVLDTSQFRVDMDIEMPMWGKAYGFSVIDTVPFQFKAFDQLQYLLFRAYISNGFPCDVSVQVYFADSTKNYQVIDSLVIPAQIIMPAASIDGNGVVTNPSVKTTDVTMDAFRMSRLTNITHILVRGNASTNNNGSQDVKIYDFYKLDVKLGVQAKLKFKF